MFSLEAKNLTKTYGAFAANKNVSLKLTQGQIHAVIGENGAGKSTLLKMLFGLESPTSGEILVQGQPVEFKNSLSAIRNRIGMVHQHFNLIENATAIENILLGLEPSRWGHCLPQKAIDTLEMLLPSESLRVPWHELVENLSVGFKQRIEILKLIYRNAQIMLFDEPTAVLTPQESRDLYEILVKLKLQGRSIVLVTHKLEDVKKYADQYTVLRNGEVQGNGSMKDTPISDLVQMMVGRSVHETKIDSTPRQGNAVLRVDSLTTDILKSISFSIRENEIVGVAGIEGSGQKDLVESILGLWPWIGEISICGQSTRNFSTQDIRQLGLAYVPEDRMDSGIWRHTSLKKNLLPGREKVFFKKGFLSEVELDLKGKIWLKNLDVRYGDIDMSVDQLSGGNQQKLVLARELSERSIKLFICHQPTRGVDVGSIEHIHKILVKLREEASALLISSDLDELIQLSDRILVLFNGNITAAMERAQFDRESIGRAMAGVTT